MSPEINLEVQITFDLRSTILYYAARVTTHTLVILRYIIIISLIITGLNMLTRLDLLTSLLLKWPPDVSGIALLILNGWIYAVFAYVIVAALKVAFEKLYLDYVQSRINELERIISSSPGAVPVAKLVEMLGLRNIYEFLAAANAYLLKRGSKRVYRIQVDPNTGTEYLVESTLSGQPVSLPAVPSSNDSSEAETEIFGSFGSEEQR
ncbi:hypothetical protein [Pyrolobus fumarii]|nr:hypothetical protein [Pyrolobus fumarii]